MNKQTEALKMAEEFMRVNDFIDFDTYKTIKEALAEAEKPNRDGMVYYKNNACKAKDAYSHDCICWTKAEKQEWQSLSDDEISSVIKTTFPVNIAVTNVDLKFARAIEQALKEKNHD